MRSESGQASVEWVGAVLLIVLALVALTRVTGGVDAPELATAGLRATRCALDRPQCSRTAARGSAARPDPAAARGPAAERDRDRAVTLPPLVPPPRLDQIGRRPRLPRNVPAAARSRFGALWRQAWLACFAYERVRYGLLHPESRPRQVVPLRGVVQMVNDCVSPFDFARDWEHLRPR
jgi:hypothetical protein